MRDVCRFCGSDSVKAIAESVVVYECRSVHISPEPATRVCYERNVRRSLSKIERSIDEILAFIKRFDNK